MGSYDFQRQSLLENDIIADNLAQDEEKELESANNLMVLLNVNTMF